MIKRELLHFGIDHLTLNIGFKDNTTIINRKSLNISKLFEVLLSAGLNDSNTNSLLDLYWDSFGHDIDIYCERSIHHNRMYAIHVGRHRILRIEHITEESTMNSLNYKYDYRITFYGTLFALSRINELNYLDFMNSFLEDISHDFVKHSVSRIDICADISGVSVASVRRGFSHNGKAKKFSKIL